MSNSRDPFLYENGTLRNLLGVTDAQELAQAEHDLTFTRLVELREGLAPEATRGEFDLDHLKAIHQHIFQDVYEWAGTTRAELTTIEGETFQGSPLISKEGMYFLPANQIERHLGSTFEELAAQDHLRGLSREEFAQRAADAFVQINNAHPFREGNGRTQREFMTQLAEQAGHTLNFTVVSQERMVQASIEGLHGKPEMMQRLFNEISTPERVELLRQAETFMDREKVNWNEMYVCTATPGREYVGQVAISSRALFVMASEGDVVVGQAKDLPQENQAGKMVTVQASPYQVDSQQKHVEKGKSMEM